MDKEITLTKLNPTKPKKNYEAPAQKILSQEIADLHSQVDVLQRAKDANLSCLGNPMENIKTLRKNIDLKKKKLNTLKKKALKAKEYRKKDRKFKRKVKEIIEKNPSLLPGEKIHIQGPQGGRPRLEDDCPDLLNVIARIAMFGAGASEKRRDEILRSCKTLADLHKEIEMEGFTLSKTSLYYRLLPRNSSTIEGKRHVKTVPVRLCRAQNDLHNDHPDQQFCKSTIKDLEIIASILGPNQVIFLSADDKARVPIGLTAANSQAPFLMHVEYRVRLPDHDFVKASKHKLIPSVYIALEIKENLMGNPEAVTYSGPTYIAIRSAKHSSSTSATHANDYHSLFDLESFQTFLKNEKNETKPVMILTTDGGPDENPRFPKNIAHGVEMFRKYNSDALFWATNAPGNTLVYFIKSYDYY